MIYLLLETGMRVSDLVRINWSNLDFESNTLEYTSKKTKKTVFIPLTSNLVILLKQWKPIHKSMYHRIYKLKKEKEQRVIPVSESRIRQILRCIKDRAKIQRKITPHDFCTTAISSLAKNKVPIGAICVITGRSPKTISLYYEKYDLNQLREYQEENMSILLGETNG
jgi:integrase